MRVVVPIDSLVLPRAQPREDGDVGDRVGGPGDVLAVGEPLVHHAVEPLRFVGVAVDRVLELVGRVDAEVMGLSEHRADAAHLEHQPLQHFVSRGDRFGHEAASLGSEVDEDRARFEQRKRLAFGSVGVDDGRDLVVRADREEFGLELVAGADVHWNHPVRQATLFEHDVNLVSVGCGPRIHFDH